MSAIRQEIIHENIPKLIKALTGFEESEENFHHCVNFAWSIIRNHRNLSVNSHEIKRKIEGIQEKFVVGNEKEYADHLGMLCNKVINHPLCLGHYEVDIQWSLLELLLTLAYNPVGALYKNKKIDLDLEKYCEKSEEDNTEYWKNVLKEDFIPLEAVNFSSDSELSDWSDEVVTNDENALVSPSQKSPEKNSYSRFSKSFTNLSSFKAPAKCQNFTIFDGSKSELRLLNSVQHSWWLPSSNKSHAEVQSKRIEANFCQLYSKFLSDKSNNLIKYVEPSTVTEHCLQREIIWIFHSPITCKFFKVTSHPTVISIQDNVSIPSVTVHGLSIFLQQFFLPPIRMMNTLKKFILSVYSRDNIFPSKTLECYAANLKNILQPIWTCLTEYENRLIEPKDKDICTTLQMLATFKRNFRTLERIYDVHIKVILDFKQYSAHIYSTFLLCSLLKCNADSTSVEETNLAICLFLTSVKIFCIIIDTWWSEGRLDDWQKEFIVERANNMDQSVSVRQFFKNKEKSFFVPKNVSKCITESKFFNLLMEHSLEAGCTLNLLYEINKIGDLRNAYGIIEEKLYHAFLDDVMASVRKFKCYINDENDEKENVENNQEEDNVLNQNILTSKEQIINCLAASDELLLMAFECNLATNKPQFSATPAQLNALQIYNELKATSDIILPLEEIILSSLQRILKARISFANAFVIELYQNEFEIQKNLQNIRKVLLFESSDLMYQFYDNLFMQIECRKCWANPFLLTIQLDDILCSKFPDISSMFGVEIKSSFRCATTKVCEAVEELSVTYNLRKELSHIITEDDLQQYNKVFRFLLKVKWGIRTLEKLQSPRSYKRRPPYIKFEMIDLIMRRLQQLRFWMIYSIQCIHFHLMTHILQSMGQQLDEKIANCTNLQEMTMVHKSYVNTVCEHCFLVDTYNDIKVGVEQLINLVFILRLEWNSCIYSIENNRGPLSLVMSNNSSNCSEESDNNYVTNSQIDAIELTYIRCHQYLANNLNNEVYIKKKSFLSGLSAAFNASIPY